MAEDATWRFSWKQLDKAQLDREAAELSKRLGYPLLEQLDASASSLEYAFEIAGRDGVINFYAGLDDDSAWMSVEADQADNGACWEEICLVAEQLANRLGGTRDAR
jgi:hypothetical protein